MSNYWFKRKRYGWGWVPATWQGWLSIALYLLIVGSAVLSIKDTPENGFPAEVDVFILVILIATTALITISYKRGPAPKWRWGKSESDNPNEDF